MVTITEPHPHRARRLDVMGGRVEDRVEIKERRGANGDKRETEKKLVNCFWHRVAENWRSQSLKYENTNAHTLFFMTENLFPACIWALNINHITARTLKPVKNEMRFCLCLSSIFLILPELFILFSPLLGEHPVYFRSFPPLLTSVHYLFLLSHPIDSRRGQLDKIASYTMPTACVVFTFTLLRVWPAGQWLRSDRLCAAPKHRHEKHALNLTVIISFQPFPFKSLNSLLY